MRKKVLALLVAMALTVLAVSGCSMNGSSTSETSVSESEGIYGEVTEVSDDSITINVGTMKMMEQNGNAENSTNISDETKESAEDGKAEEGDFPSMLDLTGETKEIKITDSTVITKESMGGGKDQPQAAPDGNQGEAPSGDNGNEQGEIGTPPDGEMPSMNEGETPPSKPDENGSQNGDDNAPNNDGQSPDHNASGQSETISISDVSQGDIVQITLDDDGNAAEIKVMSMGGGQPGGQDSGVDSYTAVKEYNSDTSVSGETVDSTGTDENAIHVTDGANVIMSDMTVTRTSEDSTGGDNASFYGVGAAILNTSGNAYINNSTITTNANGGAGIFAYGEGVVYAADTTIKTQKDTSGGIHAAGGGTLYAWDMDVETNGESSAAIRSDRGGGMMVVDGGTYTSKGTGSPAVYSTANIAVNNADLTSENSEAVCIEGLNSLRLFNSNLTGSMKDDSQNDCTWNVILYQSMSGDSEEGNSTFEMNGGTLTAKNGGMFYTTNTESTFILKDVDITYAEDSEFFLRCTGNNNQRGWGTSGQNGADCLFTAIRQEMEGNIIWDKISNLDFYMTDGSTFIGAVSIDDTYAASGEGYCNMYIEEGCTWTVTGDSTLTSLYCAGTIVDSDGETVTIKDSNGNTLAQGTGSYTITVDSYSTNVDLSGASSAATWSDYQVEKPSQFDE